MFSMNKKKARSISRVSSMKTKGAQERERARESERGKAHPHDSPSFSRFDRNKYSLVSDRNKYKKNDHRSSRSTTYARTNKKALVFAVGAAAIFSRAF